MAGAGPDRPEDDEIGALALGTLRGVNRVDGATHQTPTEQCPGISYSDVAFGKIDSRGARRERDITA